VRRSVVALVFGGVVFAACGGGGSGSTSSASSGPNLSGYGAAIAAVNAGPVPGKGGVAGLADLAKSECKLSPTDFDELALAFKYAAGALDAGPIDLGNQARLPIDVRFFCPQRQAELANDISPTPTLG
jgi:hypothetical protein